MKFIKKHIIIIISLLIIIMVPCTITLSRYVYSKVKDYILETKKFYFNSDKLTKDGKIYEINNWSGTDTFNIEFDLNNRKNNILYSDSDIEYELTVECQEGILCSITNQTGVIYKEENSEVFNLTITPQRVFNVNEEVTVRITGKSLSPYKKTLSAKFIIKVGTQGLTYEIKDENLQPYLMFIITNTRQSYYARNVFQNYQIGDEIIADDYIALSDIDKQNFSSARITLSFDPNIVILDTTTNITQSSDKQYTIIDGVSYISSITFDMDAVSSMAIRFYKKNINTNYTFPIITTTSIINFTAL